VASRYGADGEHFGEQAGNIVWKSRFPKKAPGTIKEIAPSLGGSLNFQLSVSLLCQLLHLGHLGSGKRHSFFLQRGLL
jgi:hypothetical protein